MNSVYNFFGKYFDLVLSAAFLALAFYQQDIFQTFALVLVSVVHVVGHFRSQYYDFLRFENQTLTETCQLLCNELESHTSKPHVVSVLRKKLEFYGR